MKKEELEKFSLDNSSTYNNHISSYGLGFKAQHIYKDFINDILRSKLPCILPFYLQPTKESYEEWQKAFALEGLYLTEILSTYRSGVEYRLDYFERDKKWSTNNEKMYTLTEIEAYLKSQDSLGDIHYNLKDIDSILSK